MEKGDFCDVISAKDNSLSVICSVILSLYHGCMHVFSPSYRFKFNKFLQISHLGLHMDVQTLIEELKRFRI